MVKFSSTVAPGARATALAGIGASVAHEYPSIGWTWVKLPSGMRVADGLQKLKTLPGIISAAPNHFYRPNKVPNDPLVNQQMNLSQINAFGAWEYETGASSAVTIVMIDAGIDGTHPDLKPQILSAGSTARSQDCSSGVCSDTDDPPTSYCSHGTQTAGVAAAAGNNGIGIAGISWGAKLLSLKVLGGGFCTPSSDCYDCGAGATDASLVAALGYAANLETLPGTPAGKVIVNISLGSSGFACKTDNDGNYSTALLDALQVVVTTGAGIPIAISAGNDSGPVNQPANCAGVAPNAFGIIPVGAVDQSGHIAYFSSRGPELAGYGVVAPGVNVETTMVGNTYTAAASGTSFSAPHVAGLAALIISARPDCGGQNCAQYAQNVIRGGADPIGVGGILEGAGRIDAFRSLRLAVRGTTAFDGDQKAIAFPNPFRVSQTGSVSFSVPTNLQGANSSIKIYTIGGEYVRTITGLTWDGNNATGNPVASGTYIFVVSTDNGTTRGRVAVIR